MDTCGYSWAEVWRVLEMAMWREVVHAHLFGDTSGARSVPSLISLAVPVVDHLLLGGHSPV